MSRKFLFFVLAAGSLLLAGTPAIPFVGALGAAALPVFHNFTPGVIAPGSGGGVPGMTATASAELAS